MTREQAIKEFKQTYIGLYINHALDCISVVTIKWLTNNAISI